MCGSRYVRKAGCLQIVCLVESVVDLHLPLATRKPLQRAYAEEHGMDKQKARFTHRTFGLRIAGSCQRSSAASRSGADALMPKRVDRVLLSTASGADSCRGCLCNKSVTVWGLCKGLCLLETRNSMANLILTRVHSPLEVELLNVGLLLLDPYI